MQSEPQATSVSKTALWTGRIISVLVVLFLVFDGVSKVLQVPEVVQANLQLGYLESHVASIGILLLVCVAIYVIPQTAILGAILLTAYLGGGVATHVRAGSALFPIVFTTTFGVLTWAGLDLRDRRLRALIPLRRSQ